MNEEIRRAGAVLVVTPEYSQSVPGVLKNALDWAARPPGKSPFRGKVVAITGASPGALGTARAQMDLRRILTAMGALVVPSPEVLVSQAHQKHFQKKTSAAKTAKDQLSSAQWIWYPEGNPAVSAPPGKRYFRKSFSVDGEVKSAQLTMTADNAFTVWIDGDKWETAHPHANLHVRRRSAAETGLELALGRGRQRHRRSQPAGLIGALRIQYKTAASKPS